jgi:hypothetical protein
VNNRNAAFYFFLLTIVPAFYFISCTRIHDATDLGDDLVPAVDNITTFDTVIEVETYNGLFTLANVDPLLTDSLPAQKGRIHYVGSITLDPLFGSSKATVFMELKPPFYKYYLEPKDSITQVDSAVLVMDYAETFGDTNALQTVNVYEIDNIPANEFKTDSNYLLRQVHLTKSHLLGTKTFAPSILNDSVKTFLDTTKNQLRIRLNMGPSTEYIADKFVKLFDSTSASGASGAYASDSAFRANFKGFVVEPQGVGNALMGFNMTSGKTKLALYYKYKKNGVPRDTLRFFTFTIANGVVPSSASANLIERDYTGSALAATLGPAQDDLVYLQNTPGTFTAIKIPGLASVTNRVIHRAELLVEQIYHPSDAVFVRPENLLLDVLDTALKNYRYMPYDFTVDATNTPNLISFGTSGKQVADGFGNPVHTWRFNITRYVQNYLTGREPLHQMRLYVPHISIDIYKPNAGFSAFVNPLGFNSAYARGRVRVAGGNYSDASKKMRIRIIYSKI